MGGPVPSGNLTKIQRTIVHWNESFPAPLSTGYHCWLYVCIKSAVPLFSLKWCAQSAPQSASPNESHEYYYFLRMRRHIAIAQNLNFNSAVRGIMESPMLRDEDIRLSFVSSSKLSPSADSRISNFSLR